ncbi:MAG: DUF6049 family protein [Actinomycetota bacterium]|nr:DUF6049 family protein [Actinomycetota bacterium]
MSSHPRVSAGSVLVVSLLALICAGAPRWPAQAAQEDGRVHLELAGQPVTHGPDDPLDLAIKVTNNTSETLNGFAVTVGVSERVLSRSALRDVLANSPEFRPSAFTRYFKGQVLAGGDSATLSIQESVFELSTLEQATEGGAYPLTIELFDLSLTERLDEFTTPLIYYPTPPETPLNLVLVASVNALPARAPDGTFPADTSGGWPLQDAVRPSGWLAGTVDAIQRLAGSDEPRRGPRSGRRSRRDGRAPRAPLPSRQDGLRIALAPTPRLIEELTDMRNGYRRTGIDGAEEVLGAGAPGAENAADVLEGISSLLELDGVKPLLVPYSYADLPSVERSGPGPFPIKTQLRVGEQVLDKALGHDFGQKWLLPPGGRIDAGTLQELQLGNAGGRLFLSSRSLQGGPDLSGAGCTEAFASFTCPVRTTTRWGATLGFVADKGLQQRFADLGRRPRLDRLALQTVLAETATIWAELPGRPERVVQAVIPPLWHPPPESMERLLRAFAEAPWLNLVTPAQGLEMGPPSDQSTLPSLGDASGQPGADFGINVANAHDAIQSFSSLEPPEAMVERLARNVLVAQSMMWWGDGAMEAEGLSYAVQAEREAYGEMAKIRLGVPDRITLTAREGQIRLEAFNDANYPVRVRITFAAPKLSIEQSIVRTIPPGKQQPLEVEATAEASGTSSLEVYLETPDGLALPGSLKRIAVTSTQFNRIALGLTFGALAFLVLFYVNRAIIRRRGARHNPQTTAT